MSKTAWCYGDTVTLKGALFGCGQVTWYHMRAWEAIPNVRIAAIANRTVEKAYTLATRFGVAKNAVYASHAELLEKENPDFVDIATVPDIHEEQVRDAAAKGCHILCQKPLAPSLASARSMIRCAENAGVLLSVNENWRWRAWYRRLKELLDAGVIGTPGYCCIKRHSGVALRGENGEMSALLVKQPYTANLDKLIVYEWGIHIIDVVRFLFGEPERVYAALSKTNTDFRGEDRAVVNLELRKMHVVIDISWATVEAPKSQSQLEYVEIEGNEGSIAVLPDENMIRVTTRTGTKEEKAAALPPSEEYQNSYLRTQSHFIDRLRNGGLPETHGGDNLHTLACVFAVYESASRRNVVDVEEYLGRGYD